MDEGMLVGPLIMGAAILLLLYLIAIHSWDKARIARALEKKNCTSLSISWYPFARGWLFEKGERHYCVDFINAEGATIRTTCKTTLLTGVYWSGDDEVIDAAPVHAAARVSASPQCGCGVTVRPEWNYCPHCGKARR